ncbi:hypothetical protein ABW19_dt0204493 [Dactylella cylindrospora]|nr:hypothetical protein ABW19_dt0204493 [Dactylella cylindrospora]
MDLDIPDPTDWLKTSVPGLQALETALRCQVCKEFFTAPMVTSCGHTFCSLCIRKCLSTSQKCPTCMTTDEPSRLRKNTVVQDLLSHFVSVRDQMLEHLAIKEVEEKPDEAEREEDGRRALKRNSYDPEEDESDNTQVQRRGKRRKQEQLSERYDDEGDRPRRSTRSSSQRTSSKVSSQTPIVIDDSDGDFNPVDEISDDDEFGTTKGKRKQSKAVDTPPSDLGQCPMCTQWKPLKTLQAHVNRCMDGRSSPPTESTTNGSSSSPAKKPSIPFHTSKPQVITTRAPYTEEEKQTLRIPKLAFSMMKETELRKKLQQYGLKTDAKGKEAKKILCDRLMDWTNLFNANLDSDAPKTTKVLIRELEFNERTQQNQKPSVVQKKDFERENWGTQFTKEFSDLIANAKKSGAAKKKAEEGSDSGAGSSTTPVALDTSEKSTLMTTEVNGVGSPETMIEV